MHAFDGDQHTQSLFSRPPFKLTSLGMRAAEHSGGSALKPQSVIPPNRASLRTSALALAALPS